MNYKDTEPYISAFLSNWPVNGLCGIVFNRFYRLEIHSLIGWYFRPSLWTVAPMDEVTILVYCCPSIFSLTSPLPKLNVQYIHTESVCLRGGGGVNCALDHILQEFYTLFLTRFRTYQIASPPHTKWPVKMTVRDWYFWSDSEPTKLLHHPNKLTSEDDSKGLVSVKFLRPWPTPLPPRGVTSEMDW